MSSSTTRPRRRKLPRIDPHALTERIIETAKVDYAKIREGDYYPAALGRMQGSLEILIEAIQSGEAQDALGRLAARFPDSPAPSPAAACPPQG